MKILMAVDGSEYTRKAVDYVLKHLDWYQGQPELHLLHVHAPIPPGRVRAVLGTDAVEAYYRDESAAALSGAEQVLRERGIGFKSGYRVGDIGEQIQAYAEQNGIDLLVMGSHGHGVLRNLVLGSTATRVLASSKVPVLLIR
ncbi:Nucleotide-binding universal stress protein, UspA family [Noviherbaspirillum humi]|uniref:Nucleotide-binding universal stress protein, UspA family n=1 Tax=Noviherbaspirillum humi TaxID=1688639 RepID=A0A239I8C3_9BURK|nr:universal stress protein [Noviherbaspirillum humi]SNS89333.1 Nucleotide-binding universal stress protein, UspA family [Noviherbaspirillum humi]